LQKPVPAMSFLSSPRIQILARLLLQLSAIGIHGEFMYRINMAAKFYSLLHADLPPEHSLDQRHNACHRSAQAFHTFQVIHIWFFPMIAVMMFPHQLSFDRAPLMWNSCRVSSKFLF
jgi:hypothetical protein